MTHHTLLLASGSPYRRELLQRLRLPFETWAPEVDETPRPSEAPRDTAIRLARAKAEAAGHRFSQAWIIGSDQVAEIDGHPLGKPGTVERARRQLQEASGRLVLFHTAVCLWNAHLDRRHERVVTTEVAYRRLCDAEIDRYLVAEDALDCAGSAKAEGLGITLLSRVAGDDPTALIGLPLVAVTAILRAEGYDIP